jgi:hypothetical protein
LFKANWDREKLLSSIRDWSEKVNRLPLTKDAKGEEYNYYIERITVDFSGFAQLSVNRKADIRVS